MRGYPTLNLGKSNDGFLGYEHNEVIDIDLCPPQPTPPFTIFKILPILDKMFKEVHPWNIS